MPIYKQCQLNSFSKLWVWHITEGEEELIKHVSLGLNCTNRLEAITHTNHRKGFLAFDLYSTLQTFYRTISTTLTMASHIY